MEYTDGADVSPTASPTSQVASFEPAPSFLDPFDLAPDHRERRYTCPICCERHEEHLNRASAREDLDCGHDCCQACLRKAVNIDDQRCPQCRAPLSALEVFRGTLNAAEWIEAEKDKVWKGNGCIGMKCGNPLCIGVVEEVGEDLQLPHRVSCPQQNCAEEYCARCRIPWRDQHRCEDLVRAEREAEQRRQLAEQEAEQRRHEEEQGRLRAGLDGLLQLQPPPSAVTRGICLAAVTMAAMASSLIPCSRRFRSRSTRQRRTSATTNATNARLRRHSAHALPTSLAERIEAAQARSVGGPRRRTLAELRNIDTSQDIVTRECPRCRAMTWRDQGCNMIHCTQCRTEWCFLCGRGQEHGCTHFNCMIVGRVPA